MRCETKPFCRARPGAGRAVVDSPALFTRVRIAGVAIALMCSAASCSGCTSHQTPATAPTTTTIAPTPFPAQHRVDTAGTVVYQVFLNSYAYNPAVGQTSHDVFDNAASHLPAIAQMGVTTIQLSPFHPFGNDTTVGSPYGVKDYYAVNPGYSGAPSDAPDARQGGIDALARYVAQAHAAGLHVLMDCVYHSTAPDNVLVQQHPEFYRHNALGGLVRNQFGFAVLDYSSTALRTYMINMTKFWAQTVGIDGCRADLANMVPMSFWASLNNELKKTKPGWLMIGEVPYQLGYAGAYSGPGFEPGETYHRVYAFDGVYGVSYMKTLRDILSGTAPASSLLLALRQPDDLRAAAPRGTVFYRGVDNHDQSPRAVELKGGNAGMLAAMAVNFTIGGIPFIFNGQEIGDRAPTSVFRQTFIDWTHPQHPLDAANFERLAGLVRTQPALARGGTEWASATQPAHVISYLRELGGQRVLVVVNLSASAWSGSVSVPSKEPAMKRVVDLLSGATHVARGRTVHLELAPYSYLIGQVDG